MTEFVDQDLSGAHFNRCDLSRAVMRGVLTAGLDIDAPWLGEGGSSLLVNGVDVTGYVENELGRRFPGYAERTASTPAGLVAAWAKAESAWASAVEGAPKALVEERVDGEWSFAETLRHLVMATDVWLRGAVLGIAQPYHPLGLPYAEYAADGHDTSVFSTEVPSYGEVLQVRAERVALVRDHLATATPEDLAETRPHPWSPQRRVTVLRCLHTVLGEEWAHLRFALRDLDVLHQRQGR